MIEPGDIFERVIHGERQRIVVYRHREAIPHARHPKYFEQVEAIFCERLGDHDDPRLIYEGRTALGRFIGDWGQPVAKMSVAGAYKLYRREREKSNRLEATIERLRHQISELG